MLSESQRAMAEISAKKLLDLNHWQKIQDLFAEIIGANLWLINLQGIPLTNLSKIYTCCSDLNATNYSSGKLSECALKAYECFSQKKDAFYQCVHSLTYFFVPMKSAEEAFACVLGGPVILGKRESDERYKSICQKLKIDFDHFLDWIQELKIFSHHRANLAINFLNEISHFPWPEKMLHAQFDRSARTPEQQADFLADSLLEIATQIVAADSGSVLLVDSANESFSIQSSHGLNVPVSREIVMPLKDGVAGWVVEHKQAVLIGPQNKTSIPESKLKRPQIKSSMIIPLEFQDRVYGVFCVNSNTENHRFNEQNLVFLNHLGKVASAALSGSTTN